MPPQDVVRRAFARRMLHRPESNALLPCSQCRDVPHKQMQQRAFTLQWISGSTILGILLDGVPADGPF